MTNRERYQKTFGALHASRETVLEVPNMKQTANRIHMTRVLVTAACLLALLVTTAFAANEVTDGALLDYIKVIVNGQEMQLERQGTTEDGYPLYGGTIQKDGDSSTDLWIAGSDGLDGDQERVVVSMDEDSVEVTTNGGEDSTITTTITEQREADGAEN